MARCLVTGGTGFIGSHLCKRLSQEGHWVRAVDIKPYPWGQLACNESKLLDMRRRGDVFEAMVGIDWVFALAADMGGMGYISYHDADIISQNVLMNATTASVAHACNVGKYFYSSSACVYPEQLQMANSVPALKESDAYPAKPDTEYGWEKLVTERLLDAFRRDYGMQVYVARFHNIAGVPGTWQGGREKAPAAIARKVAFAALYDKKEVEIWGDGEQMRSFCYIDDCVEGIYRLVHSDHHTPINIGSDRAISINDLVRMMAMIANVEVEIVHVPGPQGVRNRNADISLARKVLNWAPEISLERGMERIYRWVYDQMVNDSPS